MTSLFAWAIVSEPEEIPASSELHHPTKQIITALAATGGQRYKEETRDNEVHS